MQNPPHLLTEAPGFVTKTGHGRVPELEATPGRGEGSEDTQATWTALKTWDVGSKSNP